MGFNEEYLELRKKRKQEEDKEEEKSSVSYQRPLNNDYFDAVLSGNIFKNTVQDQFLGNKPDNDDFILAPTIPKRDNEGEGVFQAGVWDDGYQFGDVTKTILGTAGDVVYSGVKGLVGLAEGVTDVFMYGASEVADAVGAEDVAKYLYNGAKENTVDYLFGAGEEFVEDYSILGKKGDLVPEALGQVLGIVATGYAGAAAGLGAIGTTMLTTGVTGLSSMGSGIGEAYEAGADDADAWNYGLMKGTIDAGTELIFGGLGKTVKAIGISKGISSLDDMFAKKLSSKISSTFWSNMAEFGVKAGAEGVEEVLAGIGSAAAKKLTYMDDKELSQLIEDENLLEQFVIGAVTSGIVQSGIVPGMQEGSLIEANKTGTDFITGLTKNEQSVIDKVYNDLIAEAEKDGTKLTNKEKNALYDEILNNLEKGYISTDTIEQVLGGDSYKSYNDTVKNEDSILDEFKKLGEKTNPTLADQSRYAELKELVKDINENSKRDELKSKLGEDVFNMLTSERNGKGSYLLESYNERARRGQAFETDLSKYDTKQAEVIKKAIESGILNNTNRTHEFVDMVAKISADKGVLFDFANNAKLKESGFAIDGKFVNGFYNNGSITVNIDSPKALNTIVGHEITHVLEGTELYDALQNALIEYAKSKGDYQSRIDALTKLYEGVKDADVNAELTADLVGDYLFTDSDFIKRLSVTNRNVFKKIFDEIKYLYKLATAGSKEARALEKVKKAFEDAYRESGKSKSDPNTKYGISKTSKMPYNEQLQLIEKGQLNGSNSLYIGSPSNKLQSAGFSDAPFAMNQSDYRKSRRESANNKNYSSHAVPYEFFENMQKYLSEAPMLIDNGTKISIITDFSMKDTNGNDSYVIAGVWMNQTMESDIVNQVKSVYPLDDFVGRIIKSAEEGKLVVTNKNKAEQMLATIGIQPSELSSIFSLTKSIISQNSEKSIGNTKFSLSDSEGKQLTKEQREYFKDSKMRDDNGNLKVMYHGSQDAGFHIFDAKMSDDDISFFFVDRNDVAASYSGTSETYEAQSVRTVEDANNLIKSITEEDYAVVEENGKFTLLYEGERVADSDSAAGIYEEFCWYEGIGEGDANYKVYLNLVNPLEIDAEGRNWNNVYREFSQELADKYHSLTADEKAALTNLASWEELSIFRDEIRQALADTETGAPGSYDVEFAKNVRSAYEKLGGNKANMYDLFSIASDNFSEESINQFAVKQYTTRDYAQKAKAEEYDGVIFKNIVDVGGYGNGSEGTSTVAIAFNSNQIKSVANEKPTADKDIRYSLSDNEGNKLSPVVQKRFANSKVVDDNGNLKVVYHGTASGEFTIFDKAKGNVEGDFGSGFYFTDNEADVSEHYEGGGPDFDIKVGRRADEIWDDMWGENPDAKYEDAERKAREELYKGSHKFEVYLNIENPAIVGETILFDNESYLNEYNEEDYDDYDDYIGEVEQLVADDIDNIIWEIERNVDLFGNTDSIVSVLFDAYYEGGVDVQTLKERINELYLESTNGELVGNEVTRQIIESLGYDGIIDPTVSGKWNMDIEEGTTHYIVFKPNQIKSITNENPTDNPDIHLSLSDTNEAPTKKYGNYNVYGKDIRLPGTDDIAPVGVAENATTTEKADYLPEDYAPIVNSYTIEQELNEIQAEIDALVEEGTALYNNGEEAKAMELMERINELSNQAKSLTERANTLKAQEEAEYMAYMNSITDADMPLEAERAYSEVETTQLDEKTLKKLTKGVRDILYAAPKENKAIRKVIENYITTGQNKSELFNVLKDKFGDVYEYHKYSDIAEAKKHLRNTKFTISEHVKGDIADFSDYKKQHGIRNSKNALSVDVVYEELAEIYPGLFPSDIANETDRLERIAEVLATPSREWVKVAELTDNEIMRATDFIHNEVVGYRNIEARKAAEANARAYIDDIAPSRAKEITENVSDPTLNYQGIHRETPIKTVKERIAEKLSNVEQEIADNKRLRADSIVDFNREIARLQEEYNAKENKNTKVANNILRRIEGLQRMKNNVDADYEKRMSDLESKKAKLSEEARTGTSVTEQSIMRAELHLSKIDSIRAKFGEKGFDFDETLKNAKNLSTFATVDNTPQRVMEKSLGYREGQILADETVNKVAQNETEGIKWLNSYTDRKNGLIAQISKQYNIKPGSKESAAAQMYAEGFYVNKDNEIIKYGDNELAMDFPDAKVQANIKGLARDTRIRQIYDETLDMINESRARNAYPEIQKLENYFLHFRAMDDTFSRIGLPFNPNDIKAKDLPTDLNGVTADLKPGQPYFASAKHREGIKTSYDLLGGLERYLSSAKNQIYHIDDIQTLRALRNYIADTYGQANGLEGLDALTEEEAQEKIKQVFNAHLSTFAKFLNEEANVIAGKTALIDRGFEGIFGRRAMTFMDTLNKQVGANMVGFNVSSSLTNFIAPVQAFAKTNKTAFVKGFAQTVSNKLGSITGKTDGFAENSPVIIRRKGADRFYRTPFQKVSDAGYVLMSAVDNVSTEIIARAKFNELTAKGMSAEQAHIETDKWVSRLMGDRSLGQMPHIYNSKTLGLITKFQLEVRNQLDSQFYDTIQETKANNADIENALKRNSKTAAKVALVFTELAIAQHLFGKVFESIAGYNPAFDIIDVLMKMFGWDDDEESEDTALDNIEQGFMALLGDLPYTSTLTGGRIPISSALPITELIKGEDEYGNEKSRLETLGEIAPYYILPGGYGQFKKTAQGLGMFSDEHQIAGSYTDSGKLRFPVEDTFGNRLQAAIFGQYASENARDYFDNERAPLNEKQVQEFIDVGMSIQDYWDYREGLSKYKTLAEQADYIYGLNLTDEQKNVLINNIADRKEDIDMSDYGNYSSFEEFDYANKNPEKYEFWKQNGISYEDYASGDEYTKAAYNWAYENPEKFTLSKAVASDVVTYRQYTKELYDLKADKDEDGKSITGSRKEKVIDYVNNLDIDYGSRIILFKSEYPADDTYNYDIIDYLNNRDDISYDEMVTILRELGFTVDSKGNITWD